MNKLESNILRFARMKLEEAEVGLEMAQFPDEERLWKGQIRKCKRTIKRLEAK